MDVSAHTSIAKNNGGTGYTSQPGRIAPVAALVSIGSVRIDLHYGQTIRLGRSRDADIVLTSSQVSRHHASVRADKRGRVWVVDENSTNGLYAHGKRLGTSMVQVPFEFHVSAPDGQLVRIESVRQRSIASVHAQTPYSGFNRQKAITQSVVSPIVRDSSQPFKVDLLACTGYVALGRAADNTIILRDPLVSYHHAIIRRCTQGFVLYNLASFNGVYVNGQPVGEFCVFRKDDLISMGRTTMIFDGRYLMSEPEKVGAMLTVDHVTFTLKGGKKLLNDISFDVKAGELIAVVGPSGAGKSTLLRAITGSQPATEGNVTYRGMDLYADYARLRQFIGVVPQDDVVHRQLTVRRALSYAAELRLPSDYDAHARRREVDRVIKDLGLEEHQNTQISRLSGGQRKRTSVAMELLTQPQLLLLDEPTSGLDPGLDLTVMQLLRAQADGGRTVLVVTHSTDNLQMCDKVLILAPGGLVAYFGAPSGVLKYFGVSRYAEVFTALCTRPYSFADEWAKKHPSVQTGVRSSGMNHLNQVQPPRKQRSSRQWSTLIRRQLRIMAADLSYALSTVIMPLVIACMAFMVPGKLGFNIATNVEEITEPKQLLIVLTLGAAFMGMSSSIRELIDERPIFLRERAVGLSPSIYLSSKVCVLLMMTAIQAAIFVAVVGLRKDYPAHPLWAHSGAIELGIAVFCTSFACAMFGLLISSLVGTGDQTMPVLVVATMAQLVFCGGLFALNDRAVLEQLSWFFAGRWGFAMGASTVNEWARETGVGAEIVNDPIEKVWEDPLWEHVSASWGIAGAAIALIAVMCIVGTMVRLKRQPSTT